ncbi:MAG: TRAM domain-containing protein [Streptosporangiales bacterium]|nr:TRAM domain-containing protein [Streptosporangiales bacterium]
MENPQVDDPATLELEIEDVAAGGWCVARHDGRVVFVRHALPGERVRARVTEETKRFLRADAVEVLRASADRVPAPCPFSGPGKCGGCDWQHVTPEAQRRLKAKVVSDQLARIAGVQRTVEVEELPGAKDGLGWRTRVRFTVDRSGHAGLRRHRSHDVEPVDACLIAHPELERLQVERAGWNSAIAVEAIVSDGTGDRAVVVTPRDRRPPRPLRLQAPASLMRGLSGGGAEPVRGRPGVREVAAGRTWRVSGNGFWQVHPGAADTLTEVMLEALRPLPGQTGLDLYCGVGLFAGTLADKVGPEGRVIGIETAAGAVRDARHNLADLPQVRIRQGDVEEKLRQATPSADVIVLDPPRSGAGREVVDLMAATGARRISYISCDPATFARDLTYLAEHGYELAGLRAFDAFPMTHHVELAGTFVRD